MTELNPAEQYRLESLKARKVTTERDVAYHEQQKIKHEAAADTGALNLADIEAEIKPIEGRDDG
jgi:hypothetical protein